MNPTALFVAGAHTDVGKTHVACALIRAGRSKGLAVDALKPVVSGFDPADWARSDPGRLLAALGRAPTAEALEAISPWRFAAPLAPPMAAALEARRLEIGAVAATAAEWLAGSTADLRIVEGVGGLMSPLAEGATGLDLMRTLCLPSVLVGGSYLGAISHILTALETLHAHGLAATAVVVSQSAGPDHPDFAETMALVEAHAGATPVVAAGRDGSEDWADALLQVCMAPPQT